jgi:hypothetical protein
LMQAMRGSSDGDQQQRSASYLTQALIAVNSSRDLGRGGLKSADVGFAGITSSRHASTTTAAACAALAPGSEKLFITPWQSRLAHSCETEEAPVKIIDLFSILPAVTSGWQFAAYIVAVVVLLWMRRRPTRR